MFFIVFLYSPKVSFPISYFRTSSGSYVFQKINCSSVHAKLQGNCVSKLIVTNQLSPTNCYQPIVTNHLSSTNCHQPIATHQLSPTNCYQPIVINQLSSTNCRQPFVTNKLPPTNCHQPIATNKLPPTNCQLLCLVKLSTCGVIRSYNFPNVCARPLSF